MKILILGGTPFRRGGVEQFCTRAMRAISLNKNHDVEIVHANTAYLRIMKLGGVARAVFQLGLKRQTRWQCVWLQYVNFPDLVMLLVCRALGFRVLVTPHLGSNWASQKNKVLSWLSYHMLCRAHALALISPTQADELHLPMSIRTYQIKTFLPQHFPPPLTSVCYPDAPIKLIHVGRLSEGKGSFLFLEVCFMLAQMQVKFSAQLIGPCDAATRHRINTYVTDNRLSEQVRYLGPMSESDLLPVLAQADALIHLSEIDSFPLIVLEAIGCGVFPICKTLPGADFITKQYCGLVLDAEDIVTAVVSKTRDTPAGQFKAAAELARGRLQADYSWDHCVDLLEKVVEDMMK